MENLNLVKPEKVQNIINKFCYTIGMIPSSYKMSLTYEEQIIAIGHYLETTVYPAINNNAEALAELQNLFLDLKNYVDNYFDNLDVQEEINNKLNEMAQDGTLEKIINQNIFNELNIKVNSNEKNINNLNNSLFANPIFTNPRNLGNNSPKFISFNPNNNNIDVVQKTNAGYLIYNFNNKNGDNSNASVGLRWDLIRLKKIQFSQFAYCFKDTWNNIIGNLTTIQAPSINNSFFEKNMTNKQFDFANDAIYKNKESIAIYGLISSDNQTPAQVNYKLKYNTSNKANILFYCSGLSSRNVDIIIDGKIIENLNLSSFAHNDIACFYTYEFEIPQLQMDNVNKMVDIIIKNNDLEHNMYFCCMNYLRLEDYDGREIDSFKATSSEKYYINSDGASEYAIFDNDLNKFMGSYHGGETAIQQQITQPNLPLNYNIDYFKSGLYINKNLPNTECWYIIPTFEILQITNLNNKGNMISYFDFNSDGQLDMNFNFYNGNVNTKRFFTGLTSNSKLLDILKFPNNQLLRTGETQILNNNGLLSFSSNLSHLMMDINISKFAFNYIKEGYENGYVLNDEHYNKFYYGPIFDPNEPINVNNLSFRKTLSCFYI